ncbi:MAG: response regulator [Deltaproteobacteria bacterium]|nr:response regulator [Deltaproteobacteria bacterium]
MTESKSNNLEPNVLIADDHAVIRNMVRAILKGIGIENVATAENGSTALQRILEGDIDFVICDWNMPVMSGIDVLRRVRADERFAKLPFLMLTAEAYRENVVEAVSLGVSDYVSKPFTAEVLSEKVMKLLNMEEG